MRWMLGVGQDSRFRGNGAVGKTLVVRQLTDIRQ